MDLYNAVQVNRLFRASFEPMIKLIQAQLSQLPVKVDLLVSPRTHVIQRVYRACATTTTISDDDDAGNTTTTTTTIVPGGFPAVRYLTFEQCAIKNEDGYILCPRRVMGVLQVPVGARFALQNFYKPYKNIDRRVCHNDFFDARDWRVVYNDICDVYGSTAKHVTH